MNFLLKLTALIGACVLIHGCVGESETAQVSPPLENAKNPDVMSAPPDQVAPGQSIRIAPSNPDDPKYRPDPKLAGGG